MENERSQRQNQRRDNSNCLLKNKVLRAVGEDGGGERRFVGSVAFLVVGAEKHALTSQSPRPSSETERGSNSDGIVITTNSMNTDHVSDVRQGLLGSNRDVVRTVGGTVLERTGHGSLGSLQVLGWSGTNTLASKKMN